mgnify:CR=1 FL=1
MSTPANTFEDMMRTAEEMAKAIQKSFESSHLPQTDLAWPTLPKEWMEMLFGNAINTGGLDARTKLLLTLSGLMMQGVSNETAYSQTIRHLKAAEVSDQEIIETIAFISIFAGVPSMTKAMALAGAVLSPNKEQDL